MNNKSITLQINNKNVIITKLNLRKTVEVFKALNKLPSKFTNIDFQNLSNEKFIELLPGIIGDILPEVATLISIATPLDKEEILDELGLAEVIEVLAAIFEVNELNQIIENSKKLLARKPPAKSTKIGSTEQ